MKMPQKDRQEEKIMKRLLSMLLLVSLLCCPCAFADQLTDDLNARVPFGVAHSADGKTLAVYNTVSARSSVDKLKDYQLCAILSTRESDGAIWYQVRYISGKSFKEGYIKGDAFYPLTLAGLITVTADPTVGEAMRTLISETKAAPFVLATVKPTATPKPTAIPKPKATAKPTATPRAKATTAPASSRKRYVLNTKTMKFHVPNCSEISRITEENRKNTTTTRESLLDQGYTPCQKCNP